MASRGKSLRDGAPGRKTVATFSELENSRTLALRFLPTRLEARVLRKPKCGKSDRTTVQTICPLHTRLPILSVFMVWPVPACAQLDKGAVFQEDMGPGSLEPDRREWGC